MYLLAICLSFSSKIKFNPLIARIMPYRSAIFTKAGVLSQRMVKVDPVKNMLQ